MTAAVPLVERLARHLYANQARQGEHFGTEGPWWDDARALLPVVEREIAEARGEALREAAAWVAEGIGYPVEAQLPEHPMPQALWDALVDHVHADESGKWHGNELAREDAESWLADEAGRADAIATTEGKP